MKKRNHIRKEVPRELIDLVERHICWRMTNATNKKGSSVIKEFETTIVLKTQRPDWNIELRQLISAAIRIIDRGIANTKEKDRIVRLTSTSISIGRRIVNHDADVTTETLLRIGDIFIDALFVAQVINLTQPGWRAGDNTWFIEWTQLGETQKDLSLAVDEEVLRDTDSVAPMLTSTMLREYASRKSLVIKRADRNQPLHLDAPYIKALDKVQGQGWILNIPVMEKVASSSEQFTDPNADETQHKSHKVAYDTTMRKANAVKDMECFYQLYDLDYRGRFYTMEPFFQFQGQDFARGLFLFAEGRTMTDDGWFWLYVHTACTFNADYELGSNPDWMTKEMRDKYDAHLIKEKLDTISVDKMALNDRATWTEHHIDEILRLGRNIEFWNAAENKVSFLAACCELAHLIDNPGSLSHLPVAVDGSNNGWQHLVAMARDGSSAHLVGMTRDEIPADFYLATGKRMIELISESSKDADLYELLKPIPMKHIRKGISKRGSMTKAYSAGAGAISINMMTDCKQYKFHTKYFGYDDMITQGYVEAKEEGLVGDAAKEFAEEFADAIFTKLCKRISSFLVKAIKEVCPGPLDTMKFFIKLASYEVGTLGWFKEYADGSEESVDKYRLQLRARRKELIMTDAPEDKGGKGRRMTDLELDELNEISEELASFTSRIVKGNGNSAIKWTTPSGFPVVSEHTTTYIKGVPGNIQDLRVNKDGKSINLVSHMIRKDTGNPSVQDTTSAISPNIVHSWDASHLSLVCANWLGSIGVIHDSFSTHASDIPDLLVLIKQSFIWMYEDTDVFEDLLNQIITDNKEGFDRSLIPVLGELDFDAIMESDSFFA